LAVAVAAALGLAIVPAGSAQADDAPVWLDTSYSFSERAAALVSQMTVAEKIRQLDDKPPAIERLGVAAYDYWNEALHGVVGVAGATMFPSPTAIGSTWNRAIVSTLGNVIGDEARAANNSTGKGLTYWSPTLNISRDPRWGRADESYGEDPYLVGQIGEEFIKGVQGNDPTYLKAISTPKHYFANNSESNRRNGNSIMTEREIREYYTPAFANALSPEVGAYSFMTAYNRVNGVPMSASTEYLETMAKRQWGFDGYVTTDCSAIQDIFNRHLWNPEGWDHSTTAAEAVAWALKAGSDIDCQGNSYEQNLQTAYNLGLVTDSDLDSELTNLLTGRFLLGEFDPAGQVPYRGSAYNSIANAYQQAASQAVSNEAPVLLKNDTIQGETAKGLPLTAADAENIAVVGYLADVFVPGGYSGSNPVDGRAFNEALGQVAAQINPAAQVTFVGGGVTPGVATGQMDLCEYFFGPGYDPTETGGMTCPMYWATTTASGKPGVQNVTFKDSVGAQVGDPIRAIDSGNGYPLSITDDPAPEQFIIWEGWMGINWGYSDYMQASSVWGGYFGIRHDFNGQEASLCLTQSGSTANVAKAGLFQVHLGSLTGPIVATVPAEGANSGCDDDGTAPGTVNGTVNLGSVPAGIQDLYFVYDNGTLGDYGQEGTAGHPYAYTLDAAAEQTIRDADAVIVVVGTTNAEASEEMDRVNIDLPRFQDEVVNKVAALNNHTVVWMQSVGTMDIEAFRSNPKVPSIIWTNYNGQHQSITAANILFGRTNPSGKLPMTWYSDLDQLGSVWDYGITPATTEAGYGRTYQYFTGDVSYPFGYGLSYSSFASSGLELDASSYTGDDTITATVKVKNTSTIAGKEAVQLYVSAPGATGTNRPVKELKGFEKVSLAAGEEKTVTIKVAVKDLWFWDDVNDREIYDLGAWTLLVAPDSSGQGGRTTTFNLTAAPSETLDIVKAVPDGSILNTATPNSVIHANLSATRNDLSFYDLNSSAVKVEYSVGDATVAAVDAQGIVTPVGVGVTTVTAKVTVNGITKSDSFPVVVEGADADPAIDLPDQTVELGQAGALQTKAQVKLLPAGQTASLTYLIAAMDENTAGATINPLTGVLTATSIGQVRITAVADVDGVVDANGATVVKKISQSAEITIVADTPPPTTPPPSTPPASQPPATTPPASQPPASQPPASQAPVEEPGVTADKATVAVGQRQVIRGDGFEAGETVTGTLYPGALSLGTQVADGDGEVVFEWVLSAGTAVGTHKVVLSAVSGTEEVTFTVTAAGDELSKTGADVPIWGLLAGALLLGLGGVLLLVGRRDRSGVIV
jgi:beta-glucosidase-like glycosyl hydrolase